MSIEVDNTTDFELDLDRVLAFATHALDRLFLNANTDLFIGFIDEAAIEKLHIEFMDEPGPTDVLSFPMDELRPGKPGAETEMGTLGDIVICPTVAAKQSEEHNHSAIHEILWLTSHGILHLLGYDHATIEEESEMFGLQREILDDFYLKERNSK